MKLEMLETYFYRKYLVNITPKCFQTSFYDLYFCENKLCNHEEDFQKALKTSYTEGRLALRQKLCLCIIRLLNFLVEKF